MVELTFFLGLQIKQKEDGIFISQDKYVTEILKKFGFTDVKTARTPMETQKPLLKDEDGEEVDAHLYRSMIGSLMYLTSLRPDIMFVVCACARYQVNPKVSHPHAVKRIFRYLKASLDRKSTIGGCQFLECRLISWQCKKQTMVANSTTEAEYIAASNCCGQDVWNGMKKLLRMKLELISMELELILVIQVNAARHKLTTAWEEMGEGSANPTDPHHTPIITQPSTSQPQKKQKPRNSKRKDTEIPQSSGPTEPIADEAANEEYVPTHSNDPLLSGEDSLKLNDLMEVCIKLQQRVLDLENTKTAQAQEISSLKLRVKRLEKKGRSRTPKLKILFKVGRSAQVVSSKDEGLGDQEDASKQGRKIDDIDKDAEVTLVDETQGRYGDDLVFDTSVLDGKVVFAEQDVVEKEVSTANPVTTTSEVVTIANVAVSTATTTATTTVADEVEMTLAQTLIEIKSAKPKVVTRPKAKGFVIQEQEQASTPITSSKDKGKGIMVEEPLKMKKKDQTDYDLAQRLQAEEQEELAIEEKSKLFQQLLEKRRKHFDLFDKAMKRVNIFVDMNTELVEDTEKEKSSKKANAEIAQESSSKRAGDELEQEKAKKQKMDDDQETAKLQKLMEVVSDEEGVAIDAIPLATKPPSIVDYKIIKEGKISIYQIIRAYGSSKRYSAIIHMLRSIDREDLETLWKIVKDRHGYTRPGEGYKRVLWGDLKTMFKHHVEDLVWSAAGTKLQLLKDYNCSRIKTAEKIKID
ncbi:hypothetical protein Tco_1328094 [Tanacetum coccineum]